MKCEWEYRAEQARYECERTLSEKIYRLSRDLGDTNLSARQRALLRKEMESALADLEALALRGNLKCETK